MNVGEADRILDIYTPLLGKIRVKARGVRKTSSKLSGHLEIFSEVDLVIVKSQKNPSAKSDGVITAARMITNFDKIRLNLQKTAVSYYFCELVFWLTQAGHKDTELYNLLHWAFMTLKDADFKSDLERGLFVSNVELLLLARLGYKPELYKDADTGGKLSGDKFCFSSESGGITNFRNGVSVDSNTVKILRLLTENKIIPVRWQKIPQGIAKQVGQIARNFVHYTLEKQLETEAFLHLIEKVGNL